MRGDHKTPKSAQYGPICLECAVIFRQLRVNDPVSAWEYTRAMMNTRILTICAAAAFASMAGVTTLAQAQQAYPVPPGPVYSPGPQPYPTDARRGPGAPDFDALEDDDANMAALPAPGPVLSPDDPRYGRPVYSDRAPTGPIMSPDDPRYGRPVGPPVYSDRGPVMSPDDPRYGRPAGPPAVIYADRPPAAPGYDPNAGYGALRPPGSVGGPDSTAAVQPPPATDSQGRPMTVATLPPEEQPDGAPVQLPPNLRRQEVAFVTKEPAGTIIVDTPNTYLYYVLGGGRAIRYGVRVGRDGFTWTGVQKISKKTEWPDWFPPSEMIERQPYLPRFMAGGPGNPLGARAMYLGSTVYRIHGTNQPSTIGKFVSSGCIGMLNEDVSDLFDRAKVGTRVVVWPGKAPASTATASAAPVPGPAAPPPAQAQAGGATYYGAQPATVQPMPPPVTIR
jgi:lipoprotein-anchoring transpeptidase ErfK/SrfK